MKKIFVLFIIATLYSSYVFSQKTFHLPSVDLKTIDGKTVNTDTFSNDGKPIIIDFCATWCHPCMEELDAIADVYDDWQEKTGVKLIAVFVDDIRNSSKIGPYVNGKSWDYEVYLDSNKDFKRAMNVGNIPHTFLLNNKNEIVWQHTSYSEGDENELYNMILKLSQAEKNNGNNKLNKKE